MAHATVSTPQLRRGVVTLGILLVLMGLLINKWAIERTLASDGHIYSVKKMIVIGAFQVFWVAVGLWLIARRPSLPLSTGLRKLLAAGVFGVVALGLWANALAFRIIDPDREFRRTVRTMVISEELILKLTPELRALNRSVENLTFPDEAGRALFAESVTFNDVDPVEPAVSKEVSTVGTVLREWGLEEVRTAGRSELALWQPLFAEIAFFENAKFYIVRGAFVDEDKTEFETQLGFAALAMRESGDWTALHVDQTVRWRRQGKKRKLVEDTWLITEWHIDHAESIDAPIRLFDDVVETALIEPEVRARAQDNLQVHFIESAFLDEDFQPPHQEFMFISGDRHPGVAVADVDQDGFDDIYVMAEWGKNMLLRNRGDGTFEDIAPQLGLDFENHTSTAVFADFDNDGDLDAFLGRTLERSILLMNENGRFVDRSEEAVDEPLPYLATAVSAVDYNQDGLLDIYLSTYGAQMLQREFQKRSRADSNGMLLEKFLREEDAAELHRRMEVALSQFAANVAGPPNVLFKNVGNGRFEIPREESEPLFLFMNTFEAAWADYDNDGDPDVYCSNDLAPNHMFRNDGDGKFVDVTAETGTTDVGFGMGASWGDYDNDGNQDLYIANMYSKAGKRITSQVPGLNPLFAQMARGNSLYRNAADHRFEKVSDDRPPGLEVEIAGWAFGSQFIDVDNDTYLDIYSPNGFYTAPDSVSIPRDT